MRLILFLESLSLDILFIFVYIFLLFSILFNSTFIETERPQINTYIDHPLSDLSLSRDIRRGNLKHNNFISFNKFMFPCKPFRMIFQSSTYCNFSIASV